MTRHVLILGSNGRFGRHAAEAFWAAGWNVRLFDRTQDDLMQAVQGVDVIVNAWNPPSYETWARELPGLARQVVDAAKTVDATVILPGNLYVYGEELPSRLTAETPYAATNPLGRLRIETEAAYRDAGVSTIVLRAGDFLDTEATGNWFDMVIAKKAAKGVFSYPGDLNTKHSWAWLPDMAAAAVALAEIRDQLPDFADVLFPGYSLTGQELADLASQALGRNVAVKRMSWFPISLARPFWPLAKYLIEMRYLWKRPHEVDPTLFDDLLPGFVATPPEIALRQALEHQIDPDKAVARGAVPVAAE